jgi:hypothetical protein
MLYLTNHSINNYIIDDGLHQSLKEKIMMTKAAFAKKLLETLKTGIKKGTPYALTGLGAGAAAGTAGYVLGARRGVAKASDAFKEYNQLEDREIAKEFYNRGVSDAQMSKAANLLLNEIEKDAAIGQQIISGLRSASKTVGGSFGNLGKAMEPGIGWGTRRGLLGQSKAAIGTLAGVGGVGALAGHMAQRRPININIGGQSAGTY